MMKELNKKLAEWTNAYYCRTHKTPYNFTQSLDACFKWLVPKMEKDLHYKDYYMFLLKWVNEFTVNDSDPTLTFCLLLEKLIDGEKDA